MRENEASAVGGASCASRLDDRRAVNLIQPERIARQRERRAQPQPVLAHRVRVVADVRAEIRDSRMRRR